jgi:hypothetical protein
LLTALQEPGGYIALELFILIYGAVNETAPRQFVASEEDDVGDTLGQALEGLSLSDKPPKKNDRGYKETTWAKQTLKKHKQSSEGSAAVEEKRKEKSKEVNVPNEGEAQEWEDVGPEVVEGAPEIAEPEVAEPEMEVAEPRGRGGGGRKVSKNTKKSTRTRAQIPQGKPTGKLPLMPLADRLLGRKKLPQVGKMDQVSREIGNGLSVSKIDEW